MGCAHGALTSSSPAARHPAIARVFPRRRPSSGAMAPKAMKAGAGKPMTKGALTQALADEVELKKSVVSKLLGSLASVATGEVKKAGRFTIPGLCVIKTRVKPAVKAGKREMFGKEVLVKARPAKTVVKAFPAAALKREI